MYTNISQDVRRYTNFSNVTLFPEDTVLSPPGQVKRDEQRSNKNVKMSDKTINKRERKEGQGCGRTWIKYFLVSILCINRLQKAEPQHKLC